MRPFGRGSVLRWLRRGGRRQPVPDWHLGGLVFMLAGLAFKVSAAPFHMWTPDVYEGSPTPVTAFFATAPKVAAMALIGRVVGDLRRRYARSKAGVRRAEVAA